MSFSFGKTSRRHMTGVDPGLVKVAERALQLSAIDFGVPEYGGRRTAKEQAALFKAGKSKADGEKKISAHQLGEALDFYAFVDGKASWEPAHMTHIATAFLQAGNELGIPVQWGGLWKTFVDMPHIQLI